MKKLIGIIIVTLLYLGITIPPLLGQSWIWAESYDSSNSAYLSSFTAGQDNNLIISGKSYGDIILDIDTLNISVADELGFVARLDAMGEVVWSESIYTLIDRPGVPGYALFSAVAPDNSIVLLSRFDDTISIGNEMLTATTGSMYLAKLDENGNHLWVKNFGPETYSINTAHHVVDANGYIYVSGGISGATHFDGDQLHHTEGGLFIAKFTPDGNISWIRQSGRPDNVAQRVSDLVVDRDDNVYITGYTSQGEPEEATVFGLDTLDLAPWRDHVFLTKVDPNGEFVWTKTAGSATPGNTDHIPTSTLARGLATDGDSTILLTGYFQDTIRFGDYQFDPICGNNDCSNLYLAAFDLDGNLKWLKQPDIVPYNSSGNEVKVDSELNVYLLGGANGTIGFDGNLAQTVGQNTIFVAMFDSSGECQWTQTTGANISSSNMTINCAEESLVIAGSYVGSGGFLEPFGLDTTATRSIFLAGLVDNLPCEILTSTDSYNLTNSEQERLYPNPFDDLFYIDLPSGNGQRNASYSIELLDTSGKLLLRKNTTESKFRIDGSELPAGIYFVRLYDKNTLKFSMHKAVKVRK